MSMTNMKLSSAVIEAMETRRLLTTTLSAGVLTIVGTAGNDVTTLSVSGTNIKVLEGATSHLFPTASVSKIVADMGSGNDKLTIVDTITKPSSLVGNTGNDTIIGGGGADTIRGGTGNDSLSGGSGNDSLDGNDGVDTLLGNAGIDTFTGGTGNDSIDGGAGTDAVDYSARLTPVTVNIGLDDQSGTFVGGYVGTYGTGGEGSESDSLLSIETAIGGKSNDKMTYTEGDWGFGSSVVNLNIQLLGGPGNDNLSINGYQKTGGIRNVTLQGGIGDDQVKSEFAGDKVYLFGDDGNDTVITTDGGYPNDGPAGGDDPESWSLPTSINGGAGTDLWRIVRRNSAASVYTLPATIENATVNADNALKLVGNSLNNKITFASMSKSTVLGGAGNDIIITNSVDNLGPVTISGGDGNDSITGSKFNDSLDGDAGNDTIKGGVGKDTIQGGVGNDSLLGEAGNDTLDGDVGGFARTNDFDTMDAGDGDDFIWATDTGHSTMFGGAGNDTLSGSGVVNVSDGGTGNDLITGTDGPDTLKGGDGKDTIKGSKGADLIKGDAGDDQLFGDDGNDSVYGGFGNDSLTGGAGGDNLFGEAGNDSFFTKDLLSDTLDGGIGTDGAIRDLLIDHTTAIEVLA